LDFIQHKVEKLFEHAMVLGELILIVGYK
jgi:hypothetical protein